MLPVRLAVRALVAGCLVAAAPTSAAVPPSAGAVPKAVCGPGSLPEPGLQGQVPKADRDSGRSRVGYRCNLDLIGRYAGEGTSWVSASYGSCAYLPQAYPSYAHYCSLDRAAEPTRLACGFFNSGVRVFDISDLERPREVGYYNPAAQTGREAELPGSEHASGPASRGGATIALTADWCSSPPRFVGADQLWVSCQDNGFLTLRLRGPARPEGGAR